MPPKTVYEIAPELGFKTYEELFAALEEFIYYNSISKETFLEISDEKINDIAGLFVKRHGYNYWNRAEAPLIYPRDTLLIKERVEQALRSLRQHCIDSLLVAWSASSQQGPEPERGQTDGTVSSHNTEGALSELRNVDKHHFVAAQSKFHSRHTLPSSALCTSGSRSSSLHSPRSSQLLVTLKVGSSLVSSRMDSRPTSNATTDPRKRKRDMLKETEVHKTNYREDPESLRHSTGVTRSTSSPAQTPQYTRTNLTFSPEMTERAGPPLMFQDTSPHVPSLTNGSGAGATLPTSGLNNGPTIQESSVSTLDSGSGALPRLTFEHNLIDYSIGLDEVQYFFYWFLDEFEMERIQLRKKVREAPCERDAILVHGNLDYLKRLDSRFVNELKMRGVIPQQKHCL